MDIVDITDVEWPDPNKRNGRVSDFTRAVRAACTFVSENPEQAAIVEVPPSCVLATRTVYGRISHQRVNGTIPPHRYQVVYSGKGRRYIIRSLKGLKND